MNKEEIDKWLDNEYGVSYTRLEELHDFYFEKYCDLKEENKHLKEQLDYLRSGEYYNQLRFENEMLQQVVDTNGVPSEVYDYIDCTHRNTELLEQQQKFIEYLENMLDNENDIFSVVRVKDVLSKYKEITGQVDSQVDSQV